LIGLLTKINETTAPFEARREVLDHFRLLAVQPRILASFLFCVGIIAPPIENEVHKRGTPVVYLNAISSCQTASSNFSNYGPLLG
jgi:hypothetical protein